MSARSLFAVAFLALAVAACDDDEVRPTNPTGPSARKAPAAAAALVVANPGAKQSSVCKALLRAQANAPTPVAGRANYRALREQQERFQAAQTDVCN